MRSNRVGMAENLGGCSDYNNGLENHTGKSLLGALKGGLAPVYLLSGDEPLTQGEACDAIRAAARAAGFTEREVFFIDRANSGPWDEIFASAQALSLFAARKVIEIRIPGKQSLAPRVRRRCRSSRDWLARILVLIVSTGELDWTTQKASWVQALDAAGVWIDAQAVTLARFPAWLRARAAAAGIALDDAAVDALCQQTEGNLLAAVQELSQAVAGRVYASGCSRGAGQQRAKQPFRCHTAG